MKRKFFIAAILIFFPALNSFAALNIQGKNFKEKVLQELDLLEQQLGGQKSPTQPLQVKLTPPSAGDVEKKTVSAEEGRAPTKPVSVSEPGQSFPALEQFPKKTTFIKGEVVFTELQDDPKFKSLWNKNSHIEISFYNQVSPSGIPYATSTELVAPLILPGGERKFSMNIFPGMEGYLVAYIYYAEPGRSDIAISLEEIIGVHPEKLVIPPTGLKNIKIAVQRRSVLQQQHPFVTLSGWIHDEYQPHIGLSQTTISIVGTTLVITTDKFGRYSFPQLPKHSRFILQLERSGYLTTRVPVVLGGEDQDLDILLYPTSKFSRQIVQKVPAWDPSRFGLIEGEIVGENKGLSVRISNDADAILYLNSLGLPHDVITREGWLKGALDQGVDESGEFLIMNIGPGFGWLEIWREYKLLFKEPVQI